ncbi:MAG: efflux RND transporter periplasmic adaptor subunit, partial [Pseudomonadota bacterium]
MRITSFIAAAAVVIGLAWWFGLRPMQEDVSRFVAATSEGKASATTAEGLTETKTEPATVPQTEATQRASNADLAVPVLVVQSTEAPAKETKRLRGRTEANRTVTVEAETSGLVITQPLRAGTRVSAGDVLCRLDPGPREAELA